MLAPNAFKASHIIQYNLCYGSQPSLLLALLMLLYSYCARNKIVFSMVLLMLHYMYTYTLTQTHEAHIPNPFCFPFRNYIRCNFLFIISHLRLVELNFNFRKDYSKLFFKIKTFKYTYMQITVSSVSNFSTLHS